MGDRTQGEQETVHLLLNPQTDLRLSVCSQFAGLPSSASHDGDTVAPPCRPEMTQCNSIVALFFFFLKKERPVKSTTRE